MRGRGLQKNQGIEIFHNLDLSLFSLTLLKLPLLLHITGICSIKVITFSYSEASLVTQQ